MSLLVDLLPENRKAIRFFLSLRERACLARVCHTMASEETCFKIPRLYVKPIDTAASSLLLGYWLSLLDDVIDLPPEFYRRWLIITYGHPAYAKHTLMPLPHGNAHCDEFGEIRGWRNERAASGAYTEFVLCATASRDYCYYWCLYAVEEGSKSRELSFVTKAGISP